MSHVVLTECMPLGMGRYIIFGARRNTWYSNTSLVSSGSYKALIVGNLCGQESFKEMEPCQSCGKSQDVNCFSYLVVVHKTSQCQVVDFTSKKHMVTDRLVTLVIVFEGHLTSIKCKQPFPCRPSCWYLFG